MKKTAKVVQGSGSADLKVVPFNIRVSESEKAAFAEAASIAGIGVSTWVRERLRRNARQELEDAGRPIPFLGKK